MALAKEMKENLPMQAVLLKSSGEMSKTREENGIIHTEVEPTHLAFIQRSSFNISPGQSIYQPHEHFMRFFVSIDERDDTLPHYAFYTSKQLAFTVTQAMHDRQDMATIVRTRVQGDANMTGEISKLR